MKISKCLSMLETTLGLLMLAGCCYTNLPQPCMPPPVIISPPPCYYPCYYLQPVFQQTPTISTYPCYYPAPYPHFGPYNPYFTPPLYPAPYPFAGVRARVPYRHW